LIDALYSVSDKGREYIEQRYNAHPRILATSRLGVPDPGVVCSASKDGVLRVVSCSFMVPVKRIDRLIEGLAAAGRARPTQRIEWTHFGTGPLRSELECRVSSFTENVRARFAGYSTQEELFATYATTPIDVFVNVSASEGIPVSTMEAIACGIPVVATAVGGNAEIVSPTNGALMSANPSAYEVGVALLGIVDDPARALGWRDGSRRLWRERYDADVNFPVFAAQLASLAGAVR
jgi:glycosyltransferase involved in cell wall biosynthesis